MEVSAALDRPIKSNPGLVQNLLSSHATTALIIFVLILSNSIYVLFSL